MHFSTPWGRNNIRFCKVISLLSKNLLFETLNLKLRCNFKRVFVRYTLVYVLNLVCMNVASQKYFIQSKF